MSWFFDQLVELASNDNEVAGVIAHELGHVAYRHGLRQLIQSSVVSFVVGVYFGDVSSMAASFGALALESRYSREFEREADAYAARRLLAAGLGTEPLAAMLESMEKSPCGEGREGRPAGIFFPRIRIPPSVLPVCALSAK